MLIIERGDRAGERIALTTFPVTIGRDPSNTIPLVDEEISRFHLRIKKRGRLYICEDLESKNGTYINGDRILNSIVQNGDKILIGSFELQFVTSGSEIQITSEIMQFDMLVVDDLGLKGPISVGKAPGEQKYTPIRLNQHNVVNQFTDDVKAVRDIYELQGNLLVIDDLEEASQALLKSIGTLMPSAARAAVFIWAASSRQLIPFAVRHFGKKKTQFKINQRSLEDALTRMQGVLLVPDPGKAPGKERSRVILPMIHNNETICLIHIESSAEKPVFPAKDIELVQAFIARCAPSFETMLLRREVDTWMIGMIDTMIAIIEAKDTYTHGHSERVSRYCMAIADELKLSREIKRLLLVSALCHDIGKLGIPDAILKKASMLSAEEYEEMKLHPTIGAEIASHIPNAHRFISGIKHHHEKWDGTGYPDGLAGEEIPFFGRIVAIADVFDAMVSGRAYSGFMDQTDAIQRITEERDLFDPEILKACVRAHENGRLTIKTSTANNNPAEEEKAETTASGDKAGLDAPKPSRISLAAKKKSG